MRADSSSTLPHSPAPADPWIVWPARVGALAAALAALACATPQAAPAGSEPSATGSDSQADTAADPSPTDAPASDAGLVCAGLEDKPCPAGLECVDDPDDDCDWDEWGPNCLGVCVGPRECQAPAGSGRRYVGHSRDECARMRFVCEDGEQYFADECGCGCEPAA